MIEDFSELIIRASVAALLMMIFPLLFATSGIIGAFIVHVAFPGTVEGLLAFLGGFFVRYPTFVKKG